VITIAHVSDTHLGRREFPLHTEPDPHFVGRISPVREVDLRRAFARCIDIAIAENVDLFLHTGDLFDGPNPTFLTIGFAMDQFARLGAAGIPSLLISGNHSCPLVRDRGHVLALLRHVPLLTVVTEESALVRYMELDLQVLAIPHWAVQEDAIQEPSELLRVNLVAAHAAVDGDPRYLSFWEPSERTLMLGSTVASYDYVALGHYHSFECVDGVDGASIYYAGAPERVVCKREFDDGERGFALVRIDAAAPAGTRTEVVLVPSGSRSVVDLGVVDGANAGVEVVLGRIRFLAEGQDLAGCIVKLVVVNLSEDTHFALTDKRLAEALPGVIVWAETRTLPAETAVDGVAADRSEGAIRAELRKIVDGLSVSTGEKEWLLRHAQLYLNEEVRDAAALITPS
jgi:DNA repair exonuclease SbcCD nuclease subunit